MSVVISLLAACCLCLAAPSARAEGWHGGGGDAALERPAESARPPALGASVIQLDARLEQLSPPDQASLLQATQEGDAAARVVAAAVASPQIVQDHAGQLDALLGADGVAALTRRVEALRERPETVAALSARLGALAEDVDGSGLKRLFDGLADHQLPAPPVVHSGGAAISPETLRRDLERAGAFLPSEVHYGAEKLGTLASFSPGARLIAMAAAYPHVLRDAAMRAFLDGLGGPGTVELLQREVDRLHMPANAAALEPIRGALGSVHVPGDLVRLFDGLPAWSLKDPSDPALADAVIAMKPVTGTLAMRRRLLEVAKAAKTDRLARLVGAALSDGFLTEHRAELDVIIGPIARTALGSRVSELDKSGLLEVELILANARRKARRALRVPKRERPRFTVAALLEGASVPQLEVRAKPRPAALPAPKPVALAPATVSPVADGPQRVHALGEGERGFVVDGRPASELRAKRLAGDLASRTFQHPDHADVLIKTYRSESSLAGLERRDDKMERLLPLSAAGAAPALLEHGEAPVPGRGVVHFYVQQKIDGVKLAALSAEQWPEHALAGLLARLKQAGLALEAESREQLLDTVLVEHGGDEARAYLTDGKTSPAEGPALDDNQAFLAALLKPAAPSKEVSPAAATPSLPAVVVPESLAAKLGVIPDSVGVKVLGTGKKARTAWTVGFTGAAGNRPLAILQAHGIPLTGYFEGDFLHGSVNLEVPLEKAGEVVAELAKDPAVASVQAAEAVREHAAGLLRQAAPAPPVAAAAEPQRAASAEEIPAKLIALPDEEAQLKNVFGRPIDAKPIFITGKPGHDPLAIAKAHGLPHDGYQSYPLLRARFILHGFKAETAASVVAQLAADPAVKTVEAGQEVLDLLRKPAVAQPRRARILSLPDINEGVFEMGKSGNRVLISVKTHGPSLADILRRHGLLNDIAPGRVPGLPSATETIIQPAEKGLDEMADLVSALAADPDVERLAASRDVRELALQRSPAPARASAVALFRDRIPALTEENIGLAARFITIPAGTFEMGSPADEPGRETDEQRRTVTLTRGYEIQATQVTQLQFYLVMGFNPASFKDKRFAASRGHLVLDGQPIWPMRPVENISWQGAQEFVARLNALQDEYDYRLPTDAEWEYAARADAHPNHAYHFGGHAGDELRRHAHFGRKKGGRTRNVGEGLPNGWGLYDVHGNVREWVQDAYRSDAPRGTVDPVHDHPDAPYHISRGGSYLDDARDLRLAKRFKDGSGAAPFKGLRLVRTPRKRS